MGFKSACIQECNSGDIIASDVYGLNGTSLIVTRETELNDYIKERLMNLGVKNVYIYEPKDKMVQKVNENLDYREVYKDVYKEVYKETIILTKQLFQDIVAGKPLDYDKISRLADHIKWNMDENYNVFHCMTYVSKADEYTYVHSVNVAFYSMLIAKWLNLSICDMKNALIAGLLHDVGKVRVPETILNKARKLTREEYDIIKKHPVYGYDIVSQIEDIDPVIKDAVLLHHERMDGSGYPFGHQGEKLNTFARIVAIADVFDAMISKRVYKNRSTPFEVFDMLNTEGISKYDINIMNLFTRNIANYLTGMEVLLSNGEAGQIVYVPLHNITRPVVRVAHTYLDLTKFKNVNVNRILN